MVELDNLHRQIMHSEHGAAAQTHKAASAAAALARLNSNIRVETHCEALTPANAVRLIGAYDIVVDCTDNAVTRYLLRYCSDKSATAPARAQSW